MLDLDPGKYGVFLWSAYGLTALAFLGMIWMTLRVSAHWRRQAQRGQDQE